MRVRAKPKFTAAGEWPQECFCGRLMAAVRRFCPAAAANLLHSPLYPTPAAAAKVGLGAMGRRCFRARRQLRGGDAFGHGGNCGSGYGCQGRYRHGSDCEYGSDCDGWGGRRRPQFRAKPKFTAAGEWPQECFCGRLMAAVRRFCPAAAANLLHSPLYPTPAAAAKVGLGAMVLQGRLRGTLARDKPSVTIRESKPPGRRSVDNNVYLRRERLLQI